VKDADTFGLIVGGRKLSYETGEKTIEFGNQSAELRPVNGRVKIRLLIDRTSIEVFGNDGLLYMPLRTYQSDDSGIQVFSAGGSTTIANVKIHELKSIWR